MLGVLGGGQLGRMFVHAAQVHGFAVAVLEPDAASVAGAAADIHLQAPYTDPAALAQLTQRCIAITTEFENVPAASLRSLAQARPVAPPADAIDICQHRAREKQCFADAGVPCAPHALLQDAADMNPAALATLSALLPGILKTVSLGYDGKGQLHVAHAGALPAAWAALGGVPCVLERRLPLRNEISVIVARSHDGGCVHLPVQQNLHRDGILAVTQVPAPDIDGATAQQAVALAVRLAEALDYVGVLCVEFFVLDDGTLVANEMAPRPHNSGHYSIDACDVSQFDLQVRTLAGLPLVQPRQHSPAVMLNLLGDLWWPAADASAAADPQTGRQLQTNGDVDRAEPRADTPSAAPIAATGVGVCRAAAAPTTADTPSSSPLATAIADPMSSLITPPWPALLAMPGVRLHLYGKDVPRRGRKMGHLTVTAATAADARATALRAAALLGLPPF